ncbi:GAF domain-containing protein [Nocardia sp. NPDC005998]|uniref:GAF domain-containing protein n=1 Tax=Nocardia sp. NPDC005998 TaxID=3156894 RepID=UPI0033BF3815
MNGEERSVWYLIDAATPGMVIRYVPEEGMPRERTLHRAIRPNSLAGIASSAITDAIASNQMCAREIRIRGEGYKVFALPVPGPDGGPLAVQMWVGQQADTPVDPPAIDVLVWDGKQWTVRNNGRGGAVLPEGFPLLHGAWFLSRIIECEERDRLITAALDAQPGTHWQGPMRVLTANDEKTTRVYGLFRYHSPHSLRGLLLQVEQDRQPGIVLPTYHGDAAVGLLGGTIALIDTETLQIVEWLTPPLPSIAWRHHPASRGTDPSADRKEFNLTTTHLIHPDDLGYYLTPLLDLVKDRIKSARSVVRLLTLEHDWQLVELYCIRLPHGLPRFLTCLIRPVGDDMRPGLVSEN